MFSQYISDLLPHYLGLLTTYLLTLKNQTQYTFEDIDAFANIMQLFQIQQELSEDDNDITKPKQAPRLRILDGMMELE